jgi:signal transduction histidine kinase
MIDNEISGLLNYEKSMSNTIENFLTESNISNNQDRLSYISDYLISSNRDKIYFELHSKDDLVMKTHYNEWVIEREDIESALTYGKSYLLRKTNNNYYIFVSNTLILDGNTYVLSLIKDVSYILISRRSQYQFFIGLSLIILLLLIIVSFYVTKFITKDITKLTMVTSRIKAGDYNARTNFVRDDEIGLIGKHIDEMAFEIENNIIELKQKTLSKQRFIDNFTHEIKTPLTSIIGYADILRKNKYDKKIFDKGLYHIYDEGLRLEHLSKQLNEMILLRNKDLDITTVNINSLIKDVIEVNEMRQYGKNLSLNVDCESFEIEVDKYLLKTVLINLIDNSIKASENNQTITIGAVKEESTVTIFVEDQGRGISKADLDLITEPFYMVDNSRSKKEESFGLGLSICSELVNMMGASFKIESELGKGTKVEISIEFTTS